jgi:hypothetical protein
MPWAKQGVDEVQGVRSCGLLSSNAHLVQFDFGTQKLNFEYFFTWKQIKCPMCIMIL